MFREKKMGYTKPQTCESSLLILFCFFQEINFGVRVKMLIGMKVDEWG